MEDVSVKKPTVTARKFRRIAFTGHRPTRLGGFKTRYGQRGEDYIRYWLETYATDETVVLVGMNMGIDQTVAMVCAQMDIKFEAYLPERSFGEGWKPYPLEKFAALMEEAARCVFTSEHIEESTVDAILTTKDMETCPYTGDKRTIHPASWYEMYKRHNQGLLDTADLLIAVWDGKPSGATASTVKYTTENTTIPVVHFNPYKDKVVGILNNGGA
jgi:hypothetical protein